MSGIQAFILPYPAIPNIWFPACGLRYSLQLLFSIFQAAEKGGEFSFLLRVQAVRCTFITSFSSVQSLSCVWLFVTPSTAAYQVCLSITNSRSLPKLMCIELVMPSNYLILCHPLLLPPSIFPSIRVFSNESVLHIRWSKYWEFQLQHQSFQWIFRTNFL